MVLELGIKIAWMIALGWSCDFTYVLISRRSGCVCFTAPKPERYLVCGDRISRADISR